MVCQSPHVSCGFMNQEDTRKIESNNSAAIQEKTIVFEAD
jgi:hypothetical protein